MMVQTAAAGLHSFLSIGYCAVPVRAGAFLASGIERGIQHHGCKCERNCMQQAGNSNCMSGMEPPQPSWRCLRSPFARVSFRFDCHMPRHIPREVAARISKSCAKGCTARTAWQPCWLAMPAPRALAMVSSYTSCTSLHLDLSSF